MYNYDCQYNHVYQITMQQRRMMVLQAPWTSSLIYYLSLLFINKSITIYTPDRLDLSSYSPTSLVVPGQGQDEAIYSFSPLMWLHISEQIFHNQYPLEINGTVRKYNKLISKHMKCNKRHELGIILNALSMHRVSRFQFDVFDDLQIYGREGWNYRKNQY